jgi:hypothetical protein
MDFAMREVIVPVSLMGLLGFFGATAADGEPDGPPDAIARDSAPWANDDERTLARRFVADLDKPRPPVSIEKPSAPADPGRLYFDLKASGEKAEALAWEFRSLLAKQRFLGLEAAEGIPQSPEGPALACRLAIEEARIDVQVASSGGFGKKWVPMGNFSLKREAKPGDPARDAASAADDVAAGLLGRLVQIQLAKPKKIQGKLVYKVQVANASPFVLNGLALAGPEDRNEVVPASMAGISLPPHKWMSLPASEDLVKRLELKEGVRVVAADLSGL